MNQYPSLTEASGTVLSTTTRPRVSSGLLIRRLAASLTSTSLAFAVSACANPGSENLDQVGRSSGTTIISISAYEGHETPSFGEVHLSGSQEDTSFSEEPGADYLSGVLRDLPWFAR